jgi:flagellar protein FliJ
MMPRTFHFSLETVLQYRQQNADNARIALAKAQKAYQAQAERLQTMRTQLDAAEKHLHSDQLLAADEFWLWSRYRERLLQDIQNEDTLLQSLAAKVTAKRSELIQRTKELKILERLRNKQALDFYEQEKFAEQKELDEMGTQRYQHQNL